MFYILFNQLSHNLCPQLNLNSLIRKQLHHAHYPSIHSSTHPYQLILVYILWTVSQRWDIQKKVSGFLHEFPFHFLPKRLQNWPLFRLFKFSSQFFYELHALHMHSLTYTRKTLANRGVEPVIKMSSWKVSNRWWNLVATSRDFQDSDNFFVSISTYKSSILCCCFIFKFQLFYPQDWKQTQQPPISDLVPYV